MIPSSQKMITFINLFNNTLMTNETHLRTTSQHSESVQQWISPQTNTMKKKTLMVSNPSFLSCVAPLSFLLVMF